MKMKRRGENSAKLGGDGEEERAGRYQSFPEYLKDNEFILDFYRCKWPLKETLFSVFAWHNETLNIWTHLQGFIIFVVLTVLSSLEKTNIESMIMSFFSLCDDNEDRRQWLRFFFLMKRNATGLVAPAIAVGLGALTHTLGTLVLVIGASGFATAAAAAATAIGTIVGSFR
ncbi:unnamed protein product [Camellia sinensis]